MKCEIILVFCLFSSKVLYMYSAIAEFIMSFKGSYFAELVSDIGLIIEEQNC